MQLSSNCDYVLNNLSSLDNILGEFVSYYIKENNEPSWLNNYFKERIEFYFENIDNKPTGQHLASSLLPIELRNHPLVSEPVCIRSILPHYFRGICVLQIFVKISNYLSIGLICNFDFYILNGC